MVDPSISSTSTPLSSNSPQLHLHHPQHHSFAASEAADGVEEALISAVNCSALLEERENTEVAADNGDEAFANTEEGGISEVATDIGDTGVAVAEETLKLDVAADNGDVDAAEAVVSDKVDVAGERMKGDSAADVDGAEADEKVKEACIVNVVVAEVEESVKVDIIAEIGDVSAAEADNRVKEADIAADYGDVAAAEAAKRVKESDIAAAAEGNVDAAGVEDSVKTDISAKADEGVKAECTSRKCGDDSAVVEDENAEVVAGIVDTNVREYTEVLADNGNAHVVVVEGEKTEFDVAEPKKDGNGDDVVGGDYADTETQGAGVGEKEEVVIEEMERKKSYVRFPVRPNLQDCGFYMRTGMCKFGMNCKFNHPPQHHKNSPLCGKVKGIEESTDAIEKKKERDDFVDRGPQVDCKYFDRPGGCKFGKACKFNHSRKVAPTLELNFMGLPIRPGEKECPYYMRNGSCKFGASCRFNHPDPTSVGGSDALPSYRNGVESISSPDTLLSTLAPWSPSACLNESPAYAPMVFPPTQHAPQSEWNGYQAPLYPPESYLKVGPTYAMNSQYSEGNIYAYRQEHTLVDEFPERPGQPECAYFLKTGSCKYRSACKYHHPKKSTGNSPSYSLSDLGLPLRPGVSTCSYYSRYGICKYGPSCKYDHPLNNTHPVTVSSVDLTHGLSNAMVNKHAMAANS